MHKHVHNENEEISRYMAFNPVLFYFLLIMRTWVNKHKNKLLPLHLFYQPDISNNHKVKQ